jgi:hypothetical protein
LGLDLRGKKLWEASSTSLWEGSFKPSLTGSAGGDPAAPAVEVSVGGFGAILRRGSILELVEVEMFG